MHGKVMKFGYTNYRGEYSIRTVVPNKIIWGTTEFHPEEQWLMTAFDKEKNAPRVFAMKDMVMNIGDI